MIRTRIAPSPTGYPHIGTVYQALFNYAFAKKYKGSFIVRIEDTDRARLVEDSEKIIFQVLDWFNLEEDESNRKGGGFGPYIQSERLSIYHNYAEKLLKEDKAYFSYYKSEGAGQKKDHTHKIHELKNESVHEDPPKNIKEMIERKDWVVRMRVPKEGSITFNDQIRGEITFPYSEITEQVLIKSDGYPTYHLAVVVDDHLMKISDIVRAEEWLSSTPKHVLLYKYFGWDMPPLYHTATLRNPDKSKLSKRQGHTNVLWFKEQGYLPQAILNYLALLGWSHPDQKEIFTLSEFIKLFELKDIRPIAPIFDLTKLTWMNQQYIQSLSDGRLKETLIKFYPKVQKLPEDTFTKLIPLVHSRMHTLLDFENLTGVFFDTEITNITSKEKPIVQELLQSLDGISEWKHVTIFIEMKTILDKYNEKMPMLYRILTGKPKGLPLPETIEILGKDKTLHILSNILKKNA